MPALGKIGMSHILPFQMLLLLRDLATPKTHFADVFPYVLIQVSSVASNSPIQIGLSRWVTHITKMPKTGEDWSSGLSDAA